MKKANIKEVLSRHIDGLMEMPGVTGVAEGKLGEKPCITVFLSANTPEIVGRIPSHIEGYPVQVVGGGEFKALAS